MAQRMVSKKTLSRKNRKPRRAKVMTITTLHDSSAEQYLTLEQVSKESGVPFATLQTLAKQPELDSLAVTREGITLFPVKAVKTAQILANGRTKLHVVKPATATEIRESLGISRSSFEAAKKAISEVTCQ
jgi:hypothetical protein